HVHRRPVVAVILPWRRHRRDRRGVLADRGRPRRAGKGRVGAMTATEPDVALRIRGLVVTGRQAGRTVPILDGIDLDLRSGEIVGVVGESGSGKSTLCRAVARMLPSGLVVQAGTIAMGSVDVLGVKPGQLHRMPAGGVRMVFQNPLT